MRLQSMTCNHVRRSRVLGTSPCRHRKLPYLLSHRAKRVAAAAEVQAENLITRADGTWIFSDSCEPNEALLTVPRDAWLTVELVDSSPIGSATTGVMPCHAKSLWLWN